MSIRRCGFWLRRKRLDWPQSEAERDLLRQLNQVELVLTAVRLGDACRHSGLDPTTVSSADFARVLVGSDGSTELRQAAREHQRSLAVSLIQQSQGVTVPRRAVKYDVAAQLVAPYLAALAQTNTAVTGQPAPQTEAAWSRPMITT